MLAAFPSEAPEGPSEEPPGFAERYAGHRDQLLGATGRAVAQAGTNLEQRTQEQLAHALVEHDPAAFDLYAAHRKRIAARSRLVKPAQGARAR